MSGKFLPFPGPPRLPKRQPARHFLPPGTLAHLQRGSFTVGTPLATAYGKGVIRMFENIFGIHEQALLLQGQRIGVLATNLANADTPNYKARDIDFSAVLAHTDA